MAYLDDGIVWSESFLSAKEAVNKLGLPCMVKVVNGCKHDDFTEGHLLKLDFGIAIKKVAACFQSKQPGSGSNDKAQEIFIPLGYKGKVQIVQDNAGSKIYTSLKDLIGDFPRYVQVEESITPVGEGTNKTMGVSSGSKIELDKAIGVTSLHCKYNGKSFVLTSKDKIKFRLLADDTAYSLQEVVDRLNLPQTVRFLDPDFQTVVRSDLESNCKDFSDTVKLNRVTSHEVIIGLLRSSIAAQGCGPSTSNKKKVQPTLALFPLQASAAVNDVQVKVPADKNDKSYKSTMAKLFPQTVDRSLIQESFYVDFTTAVNIHLQHGNSWVTVKPVPKKQVSPNSPNDAAPPVPKGRPGSKILTQKEKKTDKDKEIKQGTTGKSDSWGSKSSKSAEERLLPIPKEDPYVEPLKTNEHPAKTKDTSEQMGHIYENQDSGATSKQYYCMEDDEIYDEILYNPEISQKEAGKPEKGKHKFKGGKHDKEKTPKSKAVGTVKPASKGQPPKKDKSREFCKYSVQELTQCLNQCGLPDLAKVCEKERLDGKFLTELSADLLSQEPFSLNSLHLKKLEQIKRGWRPAE